MDFAKQFTEAAQKAVLTAWKTAHGLTTRGWKP